MKGQGMALETVVKFIIFIIVALVVIGIVMYFSDDIKRYLSNMFGGGNKDVNVTVITADSFSTEEVKVYIRGCWDMTGTNFHKDATCYVLVGDLSKVNKYALINAVSTPAEVDVSNFNPSNKIVKISFEEVDDTIHVESQSS
jgi:hypothetical protein